MSLDGNMAKVYKFVGRQVMSFPIITTNAIRPTSLQTTLQNSFHIGQNASLHKIRR
jgi:hypothetical protein